MPISKSSVETRLLSATNILNEASEPYSVRMLMAAHWAIYVIADQGRKYGFFDEHDTIEAKLGASLQAAKIALEHDDSKTADELLKIHDQVLARAEPQ